MTFQDARLKLLACVRNQMCNGEITERGFARMIGISQPHAHNVLKGVRTLSPEIGDLILKSLQLSLADLVSLDEIEMQLNRRRAQESAGNVAFLNSPLGPGEAWPSAMNWRKSFPLPFRPPPIPSALAMAELTADPKMGATVGGCDVGLLEILAGQHGAGQQGAIRPEALYVIERAGEALLRYIRSGARCHYLVSDADFDDPAAWEPIEHGAVSLGNLIKARVLWLGRKRDREAVPQRGRFLYDPTSS